MHSEEKARCEEFGEYLVSHGTTVREAARYFGMSKSTVHKDVTTALKYKNPALAEEVAELLGRNKAQRHLRGGEATRRRYAEKRRRASRDGDAVGGAAGARGNTAARSKKRAEKDDSLTDRGKISKKSAVSAGKSDSVKKSVMPAGKSAMAGKSDRTEKQSKLSGKNDKTIGYERTADSEAKHRAGKGGGRRG